MAEKLHADLRAVVLIAADQGADAAAHSVGDKLNQLTRTVFEKLHHSTGRHLLVASSEVPTVAARRLIDRFR